VCVLPLSLHTRLSGASDARHSLRPLTEEGKDFQQNSGIPGREIAKVCPAVIASEAKQSIFLARDGLLRRFASRNDGEERIALQTTVSTFAWIAQEQLLTFPGPDAISTPPGTTSGLLALDWNRQ
jgi:hypothetical protein